MKPILVYITSKDSEEAKNLAKNLLEKRLVACVNLFSGVQSMYWWKGQIEQSEEVVLIAKSIEKHQEAICDLVREKHSYDCPCVVFFQSKGGYPPYLDWIHNEVAIKENRNL